MVSTWLDRIGNGIGPDLLPWLGDLIGTPLGWSLKTCAILLAACMLSLVLRRAAASFRHRVWLVALASVFLLPLLERGLPGLPVLPAAEGPAAVPPVPPLPPVPTPQASEPVLPELPGAVAPPAGPSGETPAAPPAPVVVDDRSSSASRGVVTAEAAAPSGSRAGPGVDADREAAEAGADRSGSGGAVLRTARRETGPREGRPAWTSAAGIGLAVWSAGFALWAGLLAVGLMRIGRLYRRGERAPDRIRTIADGAALATGVTRTVGVRLSHGLPVPVTWGWLRPRILLPSAAQGWEAARLNRVLIHEMAHVKRGDWATGLLGELTRCLHWFNPLVWFAVGRLRTEQERACDDRVLGSGARASDYAMDLLDVARSGWSGLAPAAVVPLARSPRLSDRIRDLLDPTRRRSPGASLSAGLSAGGLALAFLPVVMVSPAVVEPLPVPEGEAPAAVPAIEVADGIAVGTPDARDAAASFEAPPELTPPPFLSARISGLALPQPATPEAGRGSGLLAGIGFARAQQVALCTFEGSGRRSSSVNVNDDDDWTIKWSTDDCSVEVELRGRVDFNATEDGIASMGRNASFEVEERIDGARRRLVAEEDGSGGPRYRFWRDGTEGEFDAGARAWFAAFLPQLFRHTTIQAEERVARIFAASGTRGVLEEVGRMGSDHVAARYLGLLMEQSGFEPDEVPGVLTVLADRVDSDHYTAEVLGSVGDRWGIRPEFQASYMDAVRRIDSDHYAHEALMVLLERDDLAPETVRQVVQASAAVDSDHYKASILGRVASRGPIPEEERPAYIEAVATMDSDHYQHEVVSVFLDDGPLDPAEIAEVLALTETISSDHYRAEILARVGNDFDLEGPAVSAFLRSAGGIDSDHYASEVASIVASRQALTPEQVDLVLNLASRIDSDHARTQVMMTLIEEQALSPEARDRFRDLALDIGSNHYQDQVLAALARREG